MKENRAFPIEILKQPAKERLQYFEQFTMAHPKLKMVSETLFKAINSPCGSEIIMVFGPSGVGKTTLCRRADEKIYQAAHERMLNNPGHIPVVSTEIVVPSFGKFDWKDYMYRCLQELKDPRCEAINVDLFEYPVLAKTRRSESDLRRTLEIACKYRKPKVFLIDEAQHLGIIASGKRLGDQINYIKSLASTTKVVHVLFGTYELLPFRNLSGQLSRRCQDIHFSRYRADSKQEAEEFRQIVYTFQNKMPMREIPNLVEDWEYLYERSIGCVGTLKLWLNRAMERAVEEEENTVTLKHLEKSSYSIEQCKKIANEINEGEMILEEREDERERLKIMIGLKEFQIKELEEKRSGPKRVGERKPVRDSIGK